MARQPQTPEQIAARVAKSKATKLAKKNSALATLGVPARTKNSKFRKKREMTPDQKEAAVARLAAAREAKGPSEQLSIPEELRNIPDTDPFSPKRVRGWIRNTQLKLKSMRGMKESKEANERSLYTQQEVYLGNLQNYLRTGIYCDNRWGAEQQHRVSYKCVGMAYYLDGTPKRSVGTWYPDIGAKYTEEMALEEYGTRSISNKSKVY
tara:strand:- start:37 stop:660 length:624 start_codon:yes stop_codon:yes gene_type:complete